MGTFLPGTEVVLSCGHARFWRDEHHAPGPGDRVWCAACTDMRDAIGRPGAYRAVCRRCRFARTYVTDDGVANGVRRHLTRRPDHVVTVGRIGVADTVDVRLTGPDRTGLDRTETLF